MGLGFPIYKTGGRGKIGLEQSLSSFFTLVHLGKVKRKPQPPAPPVPTKKGTRRECEGYNAGSLGETLETDLLYEWALDDA